LERYNGIQLVQTIHENLAALSKVIRGISLITNEIQEYAKDLLQNEVINLFYIISVILNFLSHAVLLSVNSVCSYPMRRQL
jgi:hypothetical protein